MQLPSLLPHRKQNSCPRRPPVSEKCCTWSGCSCCGGWPTAHSHGLLTVVYTNIAIYHQHCGQASPALLPQNPPAGRAACASNCAGVALAAGTRPGELRDRRTLQQLVAGNSGAHPFSHLDVGVHGGLPTDPSGLGGSKSHRFCLTGYTNWWADIRGVSAMAWSFVRTWYLAADLTKDEVGFPPPPTLQQLSWKYRAGKATP